VDTRPEHVHGAEHTAAFSGNVDGALKAAFCRMAILSLRGHCYLHLSASDGNCVHGQRIVKPLSEFRCARTAPWLHLPEAVSVAADLPPDFAQIAAAAWQHLPEAVRVGILAMASAAATRE